MVKKIVKKIRNAYQLGGVFFVCGLLLRQVLILFRRFFCPVFYAKMEMFLLLGYWPNFKSPRSFNEKVHYRMLFAPHSLSTLVADKWAVREYVLAKTCRADILNDVFFVGSEPQKIPFDDLPRKFFIKATHGSSWNIAVRDKNEMNREQVIMQCRAWLGRKYSSSPKNASETHYDKIRPQIVVEKFIEDQAYDVPIDYKFLCFDGKPVYVQINCDRFANHRESYYDMNWKKMNFCWGVASGAAIAKPEKFDEMRCLVESIASDFDFCRVDFYCPNGNKVIFGEITLAPASGLERFYPAEWDFKLGALWNLKLLEK